MAVHFSKKAATMIGTSRTCFRLLLLHPPPHFKGRILLNDREAWMSKRRHLVMMMMMIWQVYVLRTLFTVSFCENKPFGRIL